MDDRRFDSLTRALASGRSRRSLLKGLLGLGGSAAAVTLVSDDADARRRGRINPQPPTTTPPPSTTTAAPCNGTPCGLDCCNDPLECCGGECCADGYSCLTQLFPEGPFVEEETCCRNDLICDTATTKCCNDDERCCTRDGISYCIPLDGCCFPEECPQPDNQCLDPACPVGVFQCGITPKPDNASCNDSEQPVLIPMPANRVDAFPVRQSSVLHLRTSASPQERVTQQPAADPRRIVATACNAAPVSASTRTAAHRRRPAHPPRAAAPNPTAAAAQSTAVATAPPALSVTARPASMMSTVASQEKMSVPVARLLGDAVVGPVSAFRKQMSLEPLALILLFHRRRRETTTTTSAHAAGAKLMLIARIFL